MADATRLADDISKNQTFYTVKPLLNIWAAFTPSVEVGLALLFYFICTYKFQSGIGVGGTPKKYMHSSALCFIHADIQITARRLVYIVMVPSYAVFTTVTPTWPDQLALHWVHSVIIQF